MNRVKQKNFRDRHIKMFQESGMSQRGYCREKGLSCEALKYHLRKNRTIEAERSPKKPDSSNQWLPITVIGEPSAVCTSGIRFQIQNKPSKAREGIDIINRLFDIERKLKKSTAEE